jgi:predicted HTH transcriptional regulator
MEVHMDLEEWFETIELRDINEFMDSGEQEDLRLEFKSVNKPDLSHPDDRRNFARALSGFANTSGGIVVWGISAKKNSDEIDCAQKSDAVPRISLFCSRL